MSNRSSLSLPYGPSETTPDLAEIIDAWPTLPEPIRASLLAMIRYTQGERVGTLRRDNPTD